MQDIQGFIQYVWLNEKDVNLGGVLVTYSVSGHHQSAPQGTRLQPLQTGRSEEPVSSLPGNGKSVTRAVHRYFQSSALPNIPH